MKLWVLLSLLAALFQVIRNASSRTLAKELLPSTVTFVRYAYGLPFIVPFALFLITQEGEVGTFTIPALLYFTVSAALQSCANSLLIMTFSSRSFLTAVALYRTETLFAALLGLLVGDYLTGMGVLAIIIAVVGVFLMTGLFPRFVNEERLKDPTQPPASWWKRHRGSALGLLSGFVIACSAVLMRYGLMAMEGGTVIGNVGITLLFIITVQSFFLFLWISARNPSELRKMMYKWREDLIVGAASACGSLFWLAAFALAPVARVKGVGQMELLFAWVISGKIFKETLTSAEIAGALCVVVSALVLAYA